MRMLMSQNRKPILLHMQVQASLFLECGLLPQLALIDLGDLMDQRLVVQAKLQLEELKDP